MVQKSKVNVTKQEEGFTLVELSIVLVIIGLIVGGILTGQDLIKAAQVRAEVTQLTQYSTATNTFHEKYNGLPGDLLNGVSFFSGLAGQNAGTAGYGNGDGLVQSIAGIEGEPVIFWYELNAAGLIPDPTTGSAGSYTYTSGSDFNVIMPIAKIPGGAMLGVYGSNGINYWTLSSFGASSTAAPTWTAGLKVLQASQIDGKIDDGNPSTGNVLSIAGAAATLAPGTAADTSGTAGSQCTVSGTTTAAGSAYNVANYGNAVNCALSVKASF